MKEHSLCCTEQEVLNLLAGRQTQIRMPIKEQPPKIAGLHYKWRRFCWGDECLPYLPDGTLADLPAILVKYQIGDLIRVREALVREDWDGEYGWSRYVMPRTRYQADHSKVYDREWARWSWEYYKLPAHQSPLWASRITLEVVDERAEWLWETSDEDVLACGCPRTGGFAEYWNSRYYKSKFYWSTNPLVRVVEFKVLEVKR